MKLLRIIPAVFALLTASHTSVVSAHHSFAAEFDDDNCRDFNGILTEIA